MFILVKKLKLNPTQIMELEMGAEISTWTVLLLKNVEAKNQRMMPMVFLLIKYREL